MELLETFKAEVESFIAEADIEPTTFGRTVLKDGNFVRDLRDGRSPTTKTIEKVIAYIRDQRAKAAA